MQYFFLTLEEVLRIHADQLERYGGLAGVRDPGLLESAVMMPQMMFGGRYLHAGPAEMAAAYLYHLCMNHPFLDGNKRTAAVTPLTFLELNGYEVRVSDEELVGVVLATCESRIGKPNLTMWFRNHGIPIDRPAT